MTFPLLQLPGPAWDVLVALLPAHVRRMLRQCSKATAASVDGHTTRLRISQYGPFKPLQHRFPCLAQLRLEDTSGLAGRGTAAWQPFSSILAQEVHAGVSSLSMHQLPLAMAMAAISSCRNATVCTLHRGEMHRRPLNYTDMGLALTQHICSSLPALTSLTAYHTLADADLAALSRCPSLVALAGPANISCGMEGLASLRSMRLASLEAHLSLCRGLPADVLSCFEHMTALTRLSLASHLHLEVRVPTSLVCLTLMGGLSFHGQHMPHLTDLELEKWTLTDASAAVLSAHCPNLVSLAVDNFDLSARCHTTPFHLVTKLSVGIQCTATARMRFHGVFPGLQTLGLACMECFPTDHGVLALEGLTGLVALDIACWFDTEAGGSAFAMGTLQLQASDFAALDALPHLSQLRLDATPVHVHGVANHLSGLQSITWAVGKVVCDTSTAYSNVGHVEAAFGCNRAPQLLHTARFEFVDDALPAWSHSTECILRALDGHHHEEAALACIANGQALARIVDAIITWLLSAPQLARVQWHADEAGCSCWGDWHLSVVAAIPTMQHISLNTLGDITPGFEQYQQLLYASRGLEVVVVVSGYS